MPANRASVLDTLRELVDFPSMGSRHLALPSLQCLLTDQHVTNPDDRSRNFRFIRNFRSDAPTVFFIAPLQVWGKRSCPSFQVLTEAGRRSGRLRCFTLKSKRFDELIAKAERQPFAASSFGNLRLLRQGQIPFLKIGTDYRFRKSSIEEWMADRQVS